MFALLQEALHIHHFQDSQVAEWCSPDKDPNWECKQEEEDRTKPTPQKW